MTVYEARKLTFKRSSVAAVTSYAARATITGRPTGSLETLLLLKLKMEYKIAH